jgi:hypothetical protein
MSADKTGYALCRRRGARLDLGKPERECQPVRHGQQGGQQCQSSAICRCAFADVTCPAQTRHGSFCPVYPLCLLPGLQCQVIQAAWATAERKRDDVVQLVIVSNRGRVEAGDTGAIHVPLFPCEEG